jgi:hypothetical protein
MYCKFCKHFTEDEYPTAKYHGTCELSYSWHGNPLVETTLAFAEDYESYRAQLCVSRDFGCVQFELRTPPQGDTP